MPKPTCRSCGITVSHTAERCPECSAPDPADRFRSVDCKHCRGLGTIAKHASVGGRSHSTVSHGSGGRKCMECRGRGVIQVPY